MGDDLASGFRSVDRAEDLEVFSGCLTLVTSMPFFADIKRQSFDLLRLQPGGRALDIGCGLGEDAAALARITGPGGVVVGIDGSRAMVDAAHSRFGDEPGLSFRVADAAELPFNDASFDACRIDRVLQHLSDPAAAIREAVRVLRPGGVLVAYDNDWETLTVDSPDRSLTRTVLNAWCDRFPSGWIGRQLVPLFLRSGLDDVESLPHTLVLRDLSLADRLYCFFATASRLADAGSLAREEADRWSSSLHAAGAANQFFSSYTGFLVRGVRPSSRISAG